MKDDFAINKINKNAEDMEGGIISLNCSAKEGTAQWYHNSLTTFPVGINSKLHIEGLLHNSGFYYCYGYDERESHYFLSRTLVQVFSKSS